MNIVLGVTGGIAAYKAVSLARLLVEAWHDLHVVPTVDALKFIGQPTWEAISRNPVTTSVHEDVPEVRHVALGQRADLVIIAPATANTLAKMAAGLADDLLGTTLLATKAPVLVAPAMHTEMWQHPATQHNVEVLRERGVQFIGPEHGRLTGDDSGPGRMTEPQQIFERACELLGESAGNAAAGGAESLRGLKVLVTAGGTREPIDPVRYLGNRSSGKQGVAVALAAARRGASVTLVAANIEQAVLGALATGGSNVDQPLVVQVSSTAELEAAVKNEAVRADVIVMAAAVADYRVASISTGKLRKEDSKGVPPRIDLVENPDVLRELVEARARGNATAGQMIVGFAAETVEGDHSTLETRNAELLERGLRKLKRKGCDLLAVNAVGWSEGFEREQNELLVLGAGASQPLAQANGTKHQVAEALIDVIVARRDVASNQVD